MRNRVDKLGVSEPEIRTQGDDQIVIQLAGRQGPGGGRGDHRQDGAARALRPRDVARRAVDLDFAASPSRTRPSTTCSRRSQSQAKDGTPDAYYVFNPKTKRVVSGPVRVRGGGAQEVGREAPGGSSSSSPCPNSMVVITLRRGRRRLSRRAERRAASHPIAPTTTSSSTTRPNVPRDDGRRPEALGHARRTSTRARTRPSRSC